MTEKISVGEIVNGTLAIVGANRRVVLVYLIALTLVAAFFEWALSNLAPKLTENSIIPASLLDWFGVGAGISGLIVGFAALVAQYLLFQAILRERGFLRDTARFRIFSYLFLTILLAVLTGIGFVFLVVPGFFLMARWSAAAAFLIADDRPVFEAMSESWGAVRGHTTAIALAILAGLIIYYLLIGLGLMAGLRGIGVLQGAGTSGFFYLLAIKFTANVAAVLQIALGIWLFGRLHAPASKLQDTFA